MKIFGYIKTLTQLSSTMIAVAGIASKSMYASASEAPRTRIFSTNSVALIPYTGEVNGDGELVPTRLERRNAELKISTLIASDCRLDERVRNVSARVTPRNIFPSIEVDAERKLIIVKADADCEVKFLITNPAPYGY